MSGDMIGLSPNDMRALATQLDKVANELSATARTVTNRVVNTQWRGQRREAFVQQWKDEYERTLGRISTDLTGLRAELNQLADEAQQLLDRR